MKRPVDRRKEPKPEGEAQDVECMECGFRGSMEAFLEQDPRDTICPRCGCTEVQYSV